MELIIMSLIALLICVSITGAREPSLGRLCMQWRNAERLIRELIEVSTDFKQVLSALTDIEDTNLGQHVNMDKVESLSACVRYADTTLRWLLDILPRTDISSEDIRHNKRLREFVTVFIAQLTRRLDSSDLDDFLSVLKDVDHYLYSKLTRIVNGLDWRLIPKFATPWQIIIAEKRGSERPTLRTQWREDTQAPPWARDYLHPLTDLSMKQVVWVDSLVDSVRRIPVRELRDRLLELGIPDDGRVQFIIPAASSGEGQDLNIYATGWGMLAGDGVMTTISEDSTDELAKKVLNILTQAEFPTYDRGFTSNDLYDGHCLIRNELQIRLVDADYLC